MKYQAIIFDMDGTIINSEHRWNEATLHLLKTRANLSLEECHKILPQLKGASLFSTCSFIKLAYNPKETIEELMREKEAFVFQNFAKLVTFIDGFERFHNTISKLGIPTAIATNAHLTALEKIKKHIPLQTYFKEHIYCIDHVNKKAKPLPDIYLHAAQQLGQDPELCIAIEDTTHGIAAAKAAGMFCIGINTGRDKKALAQADLVIDHYDEISLKHPLNQQ